MTNWESVFDLLPADGSTVWIRIYQYYADPHLATFDLSTQQFITVNTFLVIPAYLVSRWKNQ